MPGSRPGALGDGREAIRVVGRRIPAIGRAHLVFDPPLDSARDRELITEAIGSLDFALSFPQRLRSLVVANSIGGVQDEDYLALGRRLRPPQFDALPAASERATST